MDRNNTIERIVVDGVKVSLGRHAKGSTKAREDDWMCIVSPVDDNVNRTYYGIPVGTVMIYKTYNMDVAVKAYDLLVDGKKVGETIRLCEELYGSKLVTDACVYDGSAPIGINTNNMTLIDIAKVTLDVSSKYTGGNK
jgi:hypothetical protein